MTKRKRSDELDDALRADPNYQAMRALLSNQTAGQKRRFTQTFAEEHNMTREELVTRILELKGQEQTYGQIAETLNAEGLRTSKGGPFTRTNVQQAVLRWNRSQAKGSDVQPTVDPKETNLAKSGESFADIQADVSLATQCEPCEEAALPPELATVDEPCEVSEVAKVSIPCEPSPIPDEWLAVVRRIVREEIMQGRSEQQTTATITSEQPPAAPRMVGKRGLAGERKTLGGCSVDLVLYGLFEEQRGAEQISASELMSRILWTHYGRPRLSFQLKDADDQCADD